MMQQFNAAVLIDEQPLNPIAIVVPNNHERKQLARDIDDLGLSDQIVPIHPGAAIDGMTFRKLYAMTMDPYYLPMPMEQYFRWVENEVRPRLEKNAEVVDNTCLGRKATLLQHIIETDADLPL